MESTLGTVDYSETIIKYFERLGNSDISPNFLEIANVLMNTARLSDQQESIEVCLSEDPLETIARVCTLFMELLKGSEIADLDHMKIVITQASCVTWKMMHERDHG